MNSFAIIFIYSLVLLPVLSDAKTGCEIGKHWVSAHYRKAYTKYDGARVRATQVKAHCRKNPRGYESWHQRFSNKRPKVWGYKKEKSKEWTVEEVERLHDAISVLPKQLIELNKIKIHRMHRSQQSKNPATTNPPMNDVTLYDLAFIYEDSLAQILSHELSHMLFARLTANEQREFAKSAGWIRRVIMKKEYYFPSKSKVNLKTDSIESLEEDFANHIELYLFKPGVVNEKSHSSYKWIQYRFGKRFKIKEGL